MLDAIGARDESKRSDEVRARFSQTGNSESRAAPTISVSTQPGDSETHVAQGGPLSTETGDPDTSAVQTVILRQFFTWWG